MQTVLGFCRRYAEEFSEKTSDNILLTGATGLGKTHLSTAIGQEVIRRGFDCVYVSAQNLLSDFEYERFGRSYRDDSPDRTEGYFRCDLLIIDDFGTEMGNQFTVASLYNLINSRMNAGKPMIINTNLSSGEIRSRYDDRIASRLFGEFIFFRIQGTDIRQQKRMR
jgi:DNA replication protein DnaC